MKTNKRLRLILVCGVATLVSFGIVLLSLAAMRGRTGSAEAFLCVSRLDGERYEIEDPSLGSFSTSTMWISMTVMSVVEGDARLVGRHFTIKLVTPGGKSLLPFGGSYFIPPPVDGCWYLTPLRREGKEYTLTGHGQHVVARVVELPLEAPVQEKVILLLLTTFREVNNPRIASPLWNRFFAGLDHPIPQSPYYDLMTDLRAVSKYVFSAMRPHNLDVYRSSPTVREGNRVLDRGTSPSCQLPW